MATITETTVSISVTLRRDGQDTEAIAQYASRDASGAIIRRGSRDIFAQLSAARQQGIVDLLSDVETRVRTLLEIT